MVVAASGRWNTVLTQTRERVVEALARRADEGQSLVEFALTLPLLLLVVTGLMTFGIAMNNYLLLTDATNIGARSLAIARGNTTDPCTLVSNAVIAAAPLLKPSKMTFNYVLNGSNYSGTSCSSASTSTGAAGNLVQGSTATVTVVYPCNLKFFNFNNFTTCNMTAQTSELVQ